MGKLKFTVVPQPSYSPDLAPSGLCLLTKLKETLKGRRLSTDAEVQTAVSKWIRSQPQSFNMDRIKKWIERLNKSVAVSGNYAVKCVYSICKSNKFPSF
ncbi:hypothetical protein TNCV_3871 [Trichonephila clavipes]|nr:hypothetical protein TNCV_3871 [Trichonephila clavipes]